MTVVAAIKIMLSRFNEINFKKKNKDLSNERLEQHLSYDGTTGNTRIYRQSGGTQFVIISETVYCMDGFIRDIR